MKNHHNQLFGENVYFFTPEDDPAEVSGILNDIYKKQEANQFGDDRYAVYFMPGEYDASIQVMVGFYMQVAGLGELPTDTRLASLKCLARWIGTWMGNDSSNHNACCNFWRGVENLELQSDTVWAVSQATYMRRMQIDASLYLHDDNGWCSGGFLADSNVEDLADSGTQQQWLSRNCNWSRWTGCNWNIVFLGTEEGKNPRETWPETAYTDAGNTEWIQEKPFLIYDKKDGYMVYVPVVREHAAGVSWKDGSRGEKIPIDRFYVAKAAEDTAESINAALAEGKHLFLTPGIYELTEPIVITNQDTIVLGTGLATLRAVNGNACMKTADVSGLVIAGILFDAGERESENLLVVGSRKTDMDSRITLSDLFFRVGGAFADAPAKAKCCVTIHNSNVTGDNFWIWRADHGDHVAWDANTAENGLVVNGDNITIYALMVEHFREYQTVWNGENGKVVMYQSEIPYDVPQQSVWMSHEGTVKGYASFYVADDVQQFEAWGMGIYLYNRDAEVELTSAMEVPRREGVAVHHICTVMIIGHPGMRHVINEDGASVRCRGERAVIVEYENGVKQ